MGSFDSALTPLQGEILEALRDAPPFYLTGGAALASRYLGHRQSLDLDLFVVEAGDVEALAAHLHQVAILRGWTVEDVRTYPGFRRYLVRTGSASTLVDIVHETARQVVPLAAKPVEGGIRIDDLEDLVANKLCAVLGRGEVKDLVDLFFLTAAGIDVLAHLESARQKDAGMDRATFAYVLRDMDVDPQGLLLLRPVSATELSRFRDALVSRLVEEAFPQQAP